MSSSELYISNNYLKSVVGSTTRSLLGTSPYTHSFSDGELLIQNNPLSMEYATSVFFFYPSKYMRRIKGIDVGSTSESNGSIWVSSSTSTLRYAYNNRQYDCYRSGIANRISGSTLYVYSNSARTNLVATVPYSSSSFSYFNLDGGTYYYRFIGSGSDSYDGSFTLYNGWIRTFSGSYTASQADVYECRCTGDGGSGFYSSRPSTKNCSFAENPNTGCSSSREGEVCNASCRTLVGGGFDCTIRLCETYQISSASPQSWSVSSSLS